MEETEVQGRRLGWKRGRHEDDEEHIENGEDESQTSKKVRIVTDPDIGDSSSIALPSASLPRRPLHRPVPPTCFPRRSSLASRPAFNLSLGRPLFTRQPISRSVPAANHTRQLGDRHPSTKEVDTGSVEAENPPAASTTELVSRSIECLNHSGNEDALASTIGPADAQHIAHGVSHPAPTPTGLYLYNVIMPTACALLRSDGALAALANLMRVSKTMYDVSSEYLYRHLELTKRNIAGILWGLPYIPPHSLHATILRGAPSMHARPASYPEHLYAVLEPPYGLWIHPRDAPPSTAPDDSYRMPTGASVSRKVALLAVCRRLTVWECPLAPDAATINANYSVHIERRGIFHGVRSLRIAAGMHEGISDYWYRVRQAHPFVHVLEGLRPKEGCIDTTPVWTEMDFQRSHIEDSKVRGSDRNEAIKAALQSSWEDRPANPWTWGSQSWVLDDGLLESMRYHHPYQSGLVDSGSTSCRHQVVFSEHQGELSLDLLRKEWSGVAQTIGQRLSGTLNGMRPIPSYDIICPAPSYDVDFEEIARFRKTALLEDIAERIWPKENALRLAEAEEKITFLSPADIAPCPSCGR